MSSILGDLLFSISRVVLGVSAAFLISGVIAILRSALPPKIGSQFFVGLVFDVLRFLPPIAWIPFVILYNGVGGSSSLFLVILGACPPMMLTLYEGLEEIKKKHSPFVRSLELSFGVSLRKIYLPALVPRIFLTLRLGIGMGWISIVAAEMVAGDQGMGYSLQLFRLNLELKMMVLYLVLMALTGYALSEGLRYIEKKLFPWELS